MAVGESSARAQLLQKLPALRIFCQLPWPLAAVISNPAQQMYSRVLALLLQVLSLCSVLPISAWQPDLKPFDG